MALDPKAIPQERARAITATQTEVRLVLNEALLSHQLTDQSTAVLLEKLADIALKKLDPELKCEKTV